MMGGPQWKMGYDRRQSEGSSKGRMASTLKPLESLKSSHLVPNRCPKVVSASKEYSPGRPDTMATQSILMIARQAQIQQGLWINTWSGGGKAIGLCGRGQGS